MNEKGGLRTRWAVQDNNNTMAPGFASVPQNVLRLTEKTENGTAAEASTVDLGSRFFRP